MLALMSIIFCINFMVGSFLYGKDVAQETLQGTYKKIVDDLVVVKKKFPDSQATVYGVIDHVGKMHEIASESLKKCSDLNKKINDQARDQEKKLATSSKQKDLEFATLQNEVVSLKNDLTAANQKLTIANKNLETEKRQADKMLQEITKSAGGKKVMSEDQKKEKNLANLAKKEEAKLVADAGVTGR